eukprot:TRINITY_DN41284_c0_g1_i1.p1 TRINITY_DN41284_c0_g1~~TRINITY_DN41284_c0_g1_i1.p1  ORF type:complete len:258 (-),score=52.50 TRINITY_DN41284_c0_g1_i1:283-1056(-)
MKKFFIAASLMLATSASFAQTNATDWTATDCSSTSHNLFTDLNSGKIVVMVWVMPCGSCINGATAAYNAYQSFATSNPGKVVYYLSDDMGDASCTDLNTWITSNSIGTLSNMTVFSNAGNVINENDFGGSGMPHVVVMGGTDHKIYYNKKNSATNDLSGITAAVNSALKATAVSNVANTIRFSASPNPATNTISINYGKAVKSISITALNGQVVKELSMGNGKVNPVINTADLSAGIYTIRITDAEGKTGFTKFIKE